MTLFILSIPLMVLAVAIAVVPLVVMSRAAHRDGADTAPRATDMWQEHAEREREDLPRAA
jgi:L-cystine uptake protein TcyP (sodium:dicarboxylate symporter family)